MKIESCLVVVVSLISHVLSVDPIVTIREPLTQPGVRITRAIKDQSFDFLCEIKNLPPNTKVLWDRENENIAHDQTPDNPAEHSVFMPSQQEWKLHLKSVKLSDAGKYTCKIETNTKVYMSDYRILVVVEPPQINNLETSSDMLIEGGRELTLTCAASGIPEPVIQWTRLANADLPDGGKLYQNAVLKVASVRPEHRGKYICTAMNTAGVDRRIIDIRIRSMPRPSPVEFSPHLDHVGSISELPDYQFPENYTVEPQTTAETEIVYQAVGFRVELLCDIQAYPSLEAGQTGWSKQDAALDLASSGYTVTFSKGANDRVTTKLTIHSVHTEDYGTYVCFGRGLGRDSNKVTNTATIQLRRTSEPQKDRVGEIRSGAAIFTFSLMTMVMLVSVCFLHR